MVAAAEKVAKPALCRMGVRKPIFANFFVARPPPAVFTTTGHAHTATMGSGKKEAARKERQGKTGDGMGNVKVKGENFYRYAPTALHYENLKPGR